MARGGDIPESIDSEGKNPIIFGYRRQGLVQKSDWRGRPNPDFVGYPTGHVWCVCTNCGSAWMAPGKPDACRDCHKGPALATNPCPGCEDCR